MLTQINANTYQDDEYGEFHVDLIDDGTLDTVISVYNKHSAPIALDDFRSKEIRFGQEYASQFRQEDGGLYDEEFEILAKEAIEAYIEQYII